MARHRCSYTHTMHRKTKCVCVCVVGNMFWCCMWVTLEMLSRKKIGISAHMRKPGLSSCTVASYILQYFNTGQEFDILQQIESWHSLRHGFFPQCKQCSHCSDCGKHTNIWLCLIPGSEKETRIMGKKNKTNFSKKHHQETSLATENT